MNERIEKIEAFLKQDPRDSFLRHALALEHVKIGNEEKARELFTTLLNDDPRYLGSYYHLAKLFERTGDTDQAIATYEKGMALARELGDQHALGELRSAYEELTF